MEELIVWGFAHAPVVMADEAHNGLARCIRTKEMGVRMIRAAHEARGAAAGHGALPWPAPDTPGAITAIPPVPGGYLAQPDMRRLITATLELGWRLWAYEAEPAAGTGQAEMRTMEFANWREHEQAQNLSHLRAAPPQPSRSWSGAVTATSPNPTAAGPRQTDSVQRRHSRSRSDVGGARRP